MDLQMERKTSSMGSQGSLHFATAGSGGEEPQLSHRRPIQEPLSGPEGAPGDIPEERGIPTVKNRVQPYNKQGQLQVRLPRRGSRRRRDGKTWKPIPISNKEAQAIMNMVEADYSARERFWARIYNCQPEKLAVKMKHIRERKGQLNDLRCYISRVEKQLGIDTYPETKR